MANELFPPSPIPRQSRQWLFLSLMRDHLRSRIARRTLLVGITLATGFIVFLTLVQFSTPALAGVDGYFHIRYADLMRQQGLKPAFSYLPLTILNPREFYDHHYLFHILLIPFTLGDIRLGAKWAAIIFATFAFLAIWWLLRQQRLPYSALWALGILGISEAFIYRMSLVRVQSLSLAVFALGLHWLFTRQYKRLLPLAFIYVWLYDGFPLLFALVLAYAVAVFIIERRLELKPILFTLSGILLGFFINPYFPYNVIFIIHHILPKLTETTAINVGNEWYPYQTRQLLENSPLALVAFISGIFALGLRGQRMDVRTATSLLVALLFGWMLFQSRRFIEYFPPFALVFAALAWSPLIEAASGSNNASVDQSRAESPALKRFIVMLSPKILTRGVLLSLLILGMWTTLANARDSLRASQPYDLYQAASEWLKANTPAGSRVFQTDWDDFPRLFHHNTHNTYLIGLDPTYMQLYDADLYEQWVEITRGKVERPSEIIYNRFGARYVFTDLRHSDFIQRANEDPGLRQVYSDSQAIIYQVILNEQP